MERSRSTGDGLSEGLSGGGGFGGAGLFFGPFSSLNPSPIPANPSPSPHPAALTQLKPSILQLHFQAFVLHHIHSRRDELRGDFLVPDPELHPHDLWFRRKNVADV